MMIRNQILIILFMFALLPPVYAGTVTKSDFQVKNTQSLLNLCNVNTDDPLYGQALHFCHGYLVGAFHFYKVSRLGPKSEHLVCVPEPAPSRNDAIDQFISWANAHPEHMHEVPVETEFRFLIETWPCK